MSDDDFLRVEASDCPMSSCAVPAGSPCRTGHGKVAAQYHTARFRLVPSLAKVLNVPTPALRKPGSAWAELPRPAASGATSGHAKIGYARASTLRQSLDTQLDSLKTAGVSRIFSEKISTRATRRPELERAVALAREMRASGIAVTLVIHEHKRLGRGSARSPPASSSPRAPRKAGTPRPPPSCACCATTTRSRSFHRGRRPRPYPNRGRSFLMANTVIQPRPQPQDTLLSQVSGISVENFFIAAGTP
ncbi:recombinase family protein [Streptosporangium amethystogenes]|uniref:recombinase family protein n=1 Tax=Streptosporangium amethystogenes TaxID=2002 RepID=UPI001B805688|nr:recombinase family protein [Streptosporangium amethystogenes]